MPRMHPTLKSMARNSAGLTGLFLVTIACSGGGGGTTSPNTLSQTPTPVVPVSSTPASPVVALADLDTQEYRRSAALAQINVLPAYQQGVTGRGQTIAIVDTGIDVNNPEFAGRIHAASADLVVSGIVSSDDVRTGGASLQDTHGHGTAVAGIIAAARDGNDFHGVAPEASLLIFRASRDDSLTVLGNALEEAIFRAQSNNVSVLNLSLGSNAAGARSSFERLFARTASADIVSVISAGNEADANPDQSSQAAASATTGGTAIAVGAVDANNQLAPFSNQAGSAADFYLVAPGLGIATTVVGGTANNNLRAFSGTSAAAPLVSGAALLLRERWPNLSAAEVVQVLFDSATDLGDPGVDAVYGNGLLNIGAALQPIGQVQSKNTSGQNVSLTTSAGVLSAPFGARDMALESLGEVVVFDQYNRDFQATPDFNFTTHNADFNVSAFITPQHPHSITMQAVQGGVLQVQMKEDTREDRRNPQYTAFKDSERTPFSSRGKGQDAVEGKVDVAFALSRKLSTGVHIGLASGFSSSTTDVALPHQGVAPRQVKFLARDGFSDAYTSSYQSDLSGFLTLPLSVGNMLDIRVDTDETTATADRGQFGLLGLADSEGDDALRTPIRRTSVRAGLTRRLGSRSGPAQVRYEIGIQEEKGGALGAQFHSGFGEASDTITWYLGANGQLDVSEKTSLYGKYSYGFSKVDHGLSGFAADLTHVETSQFAVGLEHQGVFNSHDVLGIAVTQPLRVEQAITRLDIPTAYDPLTRDILFTEKYLDLAPEGREIDLEASYRLVSRQRGTLEANLLQQFNTGHQRDQNTMTATLRFSVDY